MNTIKSDIYLSLVYCTTSLWFNVVSFDKPCQNPRMGSDTRTVKLLAEDPHNSSLRVGDSVIVNYQIGEHASQYNFLCTCGSQNCVRLPKWFYMWWVFYCSNAVVIDKLMICLSLLFLLGCVCEFWTHPSPQPLQL